MSREIACTEWLIFAKPRFSVPNCWEQGDTGTNTPAWSYTTNGPGGANAETLAISSYTSGSAQLVTTQNTSACSPRISAGSAYTLGAWYESTAPTHILAYYLNSSGAWQYWTESPAFAASSAGAQAAWTTAAVPAGATALSFGLSLAATGTLTTTNYTMTTGTPAAANRSSRDTERAAYRHRKTALPNVGRPVNILGPADPLEPAKTRLG